jgi:CRISPR-associated protein Csm1
LALVGGDLMGVQKFIYTISSEGALKSLRARSFYLELATEEIVHQILTALELPRTNIIYAGASKFYLLVAATNELKGILERIQTEFNNWLLETFQRKVFLAMSWVEFPASDLEPQVNSQAPEPPLSNHWQTVSSNLSAQAFRKFEHQLDKILKPQDTHQLCKVCHRDDVPEDNLKRLNEFEDDSVLACCTCRAMFQLGDFLPDVTAFVRSPRQYHKDDFAIQSIFYHPVTAAWRPNSGETVFQINNWDLTSYPSDQFIPMLLGNYAKRVPKEDKPAESRFITAGEMAEASEGIKRVGYLRMDVDRLSQIFSKGLGTAYTLPRLASLSRQMTYFFKVYLNSLVESRQPNFIDYCESLKFQRLLRNSPKDFQTEEDKNLRKNLLFIYAGGDDLFVSGAWDEVVAFGFDVYQAFRAYTGNHPDITLSGGISLEDAKYPLYQAATDAGHAEDNAKADGRDSLGLFGEVFKWGEWLGIAGLTPLSPEIQEYLKPEMMPSLLGVLPFVERLDQQLEVNQSRSFVRNLLATAQVQTQMLKQIKDQRSREAKDIRYFLHLPKIAYTIARLPSRVRDDPNFEPVRISLKSPYNAPYFRAIATWIELLNR